MIITSLVSEKDHTEVSPVLTPMISLSGVEQGWVGDRL